ncbi:hypothetical protein SPHV1_2360067 [Novosphingobium sp. KN65.2]|nr:hypothetical protein SPHV1_2360067 [Novosphingobium sp. KN65.2]
MTSLKRHLHKFHPAELRICDYGSSFKLRVREGEPALASSTGDKWAFVHHVCITGQCLARSAQCLAPRRADGQFDTRGRHETSDQRQGNGRRGRRRHPALVGIA